MNLLTFDTGKKLDFIGVGRLCIDLNANEINRPMEETSTFTRYLGGSPANITIALSRLGIKTGFCGKIANDQFGRFILRYLKDNNVDTTGVVVDKSGSVTGLAFTEIKSPTESSILMYRDNVADLKLDPDDLSEEFLKGTRILLISGTALSKSPSREACFLAIEYARRHNVKIVFDLDYRAYSWGSPAETAIYYKLVAEKSDVILGTREEFKKMMLYNKANEADDFALVQPCLQAGVKIAVLKRGAEGSTAYLCDGGVFAAPAFKVKVLKSFGAGDAFAGAFLYGLLNEWEIEKCLRFSSAAAAIVISSHSCSEAMPSKGQIERFLAEYKE